jgi:hypothetical protein
MERDTRRLRTRGGGRAPALAGLALAAGVCLAAQDARDATAAAVESARAALEKRVEIRRAISREASEWTLGRDVLESRIELVQRELDALRAKTGETEASSAGIEAKRAELAAERDALRGDAAELERELATFESGVLELLARCPGPLRERVRPVSQRIPLDPSQTRLSVSERYQYVLGVLNEIHKFQGSITVTSEVRELDDGRSVEVPTLYAGIGAGYFATADLVAAGIGRATPEGWVWSAADDAAARIAAAVAIQKNERVAAFVQLPVSVE